MPRYAQPAGQPHPRGVQGRRSGPLSSSRLRTVSVRHARPWSSGGGGHLLLSGEYRPIAFFVTYMAVIQGAESAGQWLSFGPNAAQASAAANRILSVRETRNRDSVSISENDP